ncbi:serine hydrolase domain-containing protein [Streptomyces sp. SID3343]|uniref:serine hydrolase domain-containing protein n=1 Tax=Streptomyces sp. SID3343 TaxID=2690260 RepID=UPI001371A6AA|nr:serine hydrolase domain-containing protein [Streptomyces sp. SID3343]MYW02699.1 serine hydrolase [Streptomyces sp. SID3343]
MGRRAGGRRWAVGAAAVSVALVAVTASASAGGAPRGRYDERVLRGDLRAVAAVGGGSVNLSAEVRVGDRVVRGRSGTSVAGTRTPVPWDARFRIASTTKTFTATVALQLVAEGRLSLDDTVERWLPGVVTGNGNDGARVTVRDLLRQTSGIFDYVEDPEIQDTLLRDFESVRYDTRPARDLVAVAMRHAPAFVPDGARPKWAYSNTNYVLAGMIVERAGGLPWREQVEHRIIAPLGLRDTSVPGANPFLPGPHNQVLVDFPDGNRRDVTDASLAHDADAGIVATAADLDTFFRALVTGRLLPPAQLAEMRTTVERSNDPDDLAEWPQGGYGLGLRWVPLTCGGGYWHHEGDGFGSYVRTGVTSDGSRVVALSITSNGAPPDQVRLNAATRVLVDHALCAT